MNEGEAGRSPPTRWRATALLCVSAAALLIAVALATRNPVPLFLAVPLLLAPAAAVASGPSDRFTVRLTWGAEGATGEVTIRGEFEPPGGLTAESFDLVFYRTAPLVELAAPQVESQGARVVFTLRWSAPFPCLVTVPLPDIFWRDPLGLVERRIRVSGEALKVERFPPEVTRIGRVRLHRTTPLPGEVRSRTIGGSGEFFAIRTAAPGDTSRQINWKASARSGRLLANEYLQERTGDLLILLDLRPSPLGPERDAQLLSIAKAGALGLATGLLAEKSRVGLGLFDEFLTALPLGSGRLQRHRFVQVLQRARVGNVGGPSERFAVSLRRYFPPGVSAVLISPLADEHATSLLTHLRWRGYATFVLSPSPLPLLAPLPGKATADDALAMRLLTLVRRHRVSQVWREAPVVDWPDYWSLAPLLRYLSQPSRQEPHA
ncbi:MAG: DUF58 domain-containing protein [Thermoplasmata archaeon]|nr:DUF58 domain-containing protein [Thermoplasmata archaeon]